MSGPVQPSPADPAPTRGPLRQLAEVRGWVGGFSGPHRQVRLTTADGVTLAAYHLPGPGAPAAGAPAAGAPAAAPGMRHRTAAERPATAGTHQRATADRPAAPGMRHPAERRAADPPAVVLVHGFAAHARKPAYARLAEQLASAFEVLALDLRGHGRSGGASSLGGREAWDVAAAVEWFRQRGRRWVAVVGVSMGGTAVAYAASLGVPVDAVVLVSTPGWLRAQPGSAATRSLQRWWQRPWRRLLMRAIIGVRVVPPRRWVAPPHPVTAVARVSCPVLVVHGPDDHYFPLSDAEALAAAAPAGRLWVPPAPFGHAEDGFTPRFAAALTEALRTLWEQTAARPSGDGPGSDGSHG